MIVAVMPRWLRWLRNSPEPYTESPSTSVPAGSSAIRSGAAWASPTLPATCPRPGAKLSTSASPGSSPTLTPPPACATHAGSPRVRANSAAELLLELLPGVPVITVDSAARLIGRSEMRTGEAVNRLEAAGILRQRDVGRQRYRVFEAADVVDLFRSRTSPRPAPPVTATAAPTRRVARRMHSADDET